VIVIHDDLDLDPGRVRLKARGGHGGHNGVLSLIESLQNDGFPRVKIGVGRPPQGVDAADYVLAPVSREERLILDKASEAALAAVDCWIDEGLAAAMNRFNGTSAGEVP
jgi:PTH1 family peptidyl-tRNA hydrolase